MLELKTKYICILESYIIYIICTFQIRFWTIQQPNLCESTALENKLKRWFFTQKPVLNVSFNDFWYTKRMTNSINKHYKLKIPYTHITIFLPFITINYIHQTKSESKIYIFLLNWQKPHIIWNTYCVNLLLKILA